MTTKIILRKQSTNKKVLQGRRYCCDFSIRLLFVIFLIFSGGLFLFYVLWFTNAYHDSIYKAMAISKGSMAYKMWFDPPIHALLRVRVFNYTNVEEFLSGNATKLKVQDIGPYIYHEFRYKAGVSFEDNLITYQENRSHEFLPELSGNNSESDKIIVPNVFLIAAYELSKSILVGQIALKLAKVQTKSKTFKELTFKEFMWGYRDDFMKRLFLSDTFGALKERGGVSPDRFTVFTGQNDIRNLKKFHAKNGRLKLPYWTGDYCNNITGYDGSQILPFIIQNKEPFKLFLTMFCRTVSFYFDSMQVKSNGLVGYRYKSFPSMLYTSTKEPLNKCFEYDEKYVYQGLVQMAPCLKNAPIILSFPHFYTGDPVLLEPFEGLNPNIEEHGSHVEYHRSGFLLTARTKLQVNIVVKGYDLDPKIKKDIILPVLWIEDYLEDFPKSIVFLLKLFDFVTVEFYYFLKYFSVVVVILSEIVFIYGVVNYKSHSQKFATFTNDANVSLIGSKTEY